MISPQSPPPHGLQRPVTSFLDTICSASQAYPHTHMRKNCTPLAGRNNLIWRPQLSPGRCRHLQLAGPLVWLLFYPFSSEGNVRKKNPTYTLVSCCRHVPLAASFSLVVHRSAEGSVRPERTMSFVSAIYSEPNRPSCKRFEHWDLQHDREIPRDCKRFRAMVSVLSAWLLTNSALIPLHVNPTCLTVVCNGLESNT